MGSKARVFVCPRFFFHRYVIMTGQSNLSNQFLRQVNTSQSDNLGGFIYLRMKEYNLRCISGPEKGGHSRRTSVPTSI